MDLGKIDQPSLQLLNLFTKLQKKYRSRKYTIGIFLDLSKAFDTIDHRILISKLEYYGIRGIVKVWFENYLSNRKQLLNTIK